LPGPPSTDVTFVVVFTSEIAGTDAVTFTENVHVTPPKIEPPVRLIDPDPTTAVSVPPQVGLETPFGLATVIPMGRVSENPTPVRVTAGEELGLLIVNVNGTDVF
jgi:hypothetical protein